MNPDGTAPTNLASTAGIDFTELAAGRSAPASRTRFPAGATRPILDGPVSGAAMSSGAASRRTAMEAERVTASTTIEATPEAVFAVLADPSAHADVDGTGWVRGSLDGDRITAAGQVFRMAMYHPNHPDKDYKIANLVEVFDEPRAIAWKPGTESPETGELSFGGWTWRYDLEATGSSRTRVTLTYDWSGVGPEVREYLEFPPFGQDHLDNSLQHLSALVA
jgi:polyketide cyclase/dehydrase/lipid transport protein